MLSGLGFRNSHRYFHTHSFESKVLWWSPTCASVFKLYQTNYVSQYYMKLTSVANQVYEQSNSIGTLQLNLL